MGGGGRVTAIRDTVISIACLVLMALIPSALYYSYVLSDFSGTEPSFLLGSLGAFEMAVVIWIASATGLATMLLFRMRSRKPRAMKEGTELAFLSLFMLESVGASVVLILFALNLLGKYEWSDAGSIAFCLVPTAALVTGGVVFIETARFDEGIGRIVRRLAFVLTVISVPWAVMIAAFGFLGYGGTS